MKINKKKNDQRFTSPKMKAMKTINKMRFL